MPRCSCFKTSVLSKKRYLIHPWYAQMNSFHTFHFLKSTSNDPGYQTVNYSFPKFQGQRTWRIIWESRVYFSSIDKWRCVYNGELPTIYLQVSTVTFPVSLEEKITMEHLFFNKWMMKFQENGYFWLNYFIQILHKSMLDHYIFIYTQ